MEGHTAEIRLGHAIGGQGGDVNVTNSHFSAGPISRSVGRVIRRSVAGGSVMARKLPQFYIFSYLILH